MTFMETERLVIRNFTPDDANDLCDILGDAEAMKYCEPVYDLEKTKVFLHSFCIDRNGAVAAVHKQLQKVIGYILFNEFDPGVYEMGWIFNRSYWRRGYAYEACKTVMDYAFCELDAHKVFAETIDGVKSAGLMQKLGMKSEGMEKNHGAKLCCYGLAREDWNKNEG